jgi:hypothetical protein
MGEVINVPITKGKTTIAINTDDIPDAVYKEIILQGLKTVLNRGMSKITKELYPKEDELKAAAMAKATANVQDVKDGKVRITGGKKKEATGTINTEAMRLARNLVKDAMKANGIKVSHVEASEITKAAKEVLAGDMGDGLLAQAKENIAKRKEKVGSITEGIISGIKISDKLVKAAETRKAKAKEQGSAGNITKGATRAKPTAHAHA